MRAFLMADIYVRLRKKLMGELAGLGMVFFISYRKVWYLRKNVLSLHRV